MNNRTKQRKTIHFLPGTQCNDLLWEKLAPHLDEDFDLVFLRIPRHKSFDEMLEHFQSTIRSEKLNLVGFSLGGYLATYFAIKLPSQVEKLFVISNSPTALPDQELKQRESTLSLIGKHGYTGMGRSKAASMLDPENQTDEIIESILAMDRALGADELTSQYRYTSKRLNLAENLANFPKPAHFYFSQGDPLVNPTWLNRLSNKNANISTTCTQGSGHMLPMEKPRELASLIRSWMAQ